MAIDTPFNQPTTRLGTWIFRFIQWMENRIRRASLVGDAYFFDPAQFSWAESVQEEWLRIRKELNTILPQRDLLPAFQEISEEVGYITHDRDWKTFFLLGYGVRSHQNELLCPDTIEILNKIPGLVTAFFSILEPGKRLPPHRGPYNGVLRLHLGLVVPQARDRCWLQVGDQVRHWQEGEVLIFDDSHVHEAINDTDEVRVVLFVDFARPCTFWISRLNHMVIAAARMSPFIRSAKRNQRQWENDHKDFARNVVASKSAD